MKTDATKLPKKGRGFTWSRAPRDEGRAMQWRLHRWDMRGVLHISYVRADPIMMARDRRQVAQWLRSARRNLRDRVDEIDIAILEQESAALG